jgi:beta-glucosidase
VSDVAIVNAVKSGALDEQALDEAVRRMLRLVERAQPALDDPASYDEDGHHALARRAAAESAVLLKNEEDALPLRPAAGDTVAVIGEFARTPRYQGAGSSQVTPTRLDVALDELRAALGDQVQVEFSAGFGIGGTSADDELAAAAVETARSADHVLLFLGLPAADESEGFDRTHLDLPANQLALLEALAEAGVRPIVALANGSVVSLAGWQQHTRAILECWLGGQAAGGAIADLITGRVNPSGKLAETIPVRLEDNPSFLNFPGEHQIVRYGEGIFVGYRGYDKRTQEVAFPFGFGLSYTTFGYDDAVVEVEGSVAGGDLRVNVQARVTNTGDVAGGEVVQVYVGDVECSAARPVRELKGFAKVQLEPGATQTVRIELSERAFAHWSIVDHRWLVEEGEFEIAIGGSSRDLPLRQTITVPAPRPQRRLTGENTLQEWLADDRARALITAGGTPALLEDEHLVKVIGTMPMQTLAAFNMGLNHQTLDLLTEALARS